MRKYIIGLILLFTSMTVGAQKQRFINLTVQDIEIDSLLPEFTYSIPLGPNYADSTYQLEIRYPEFIDMSEHDIELFNKAGGTKLHPLPEIHQQITIDRKNGNLEFYMTPIVERNGKKQFLVSFMIAMTSTPIKKTARKANAMTRAVGSQARYAEHSVLASGKWAKIRIPANGVYQLTDALIKNAGFTDASKVKIYGYGGNLQNEKLEEADLIEFDDLKEIPTCTVNGRRLFYGRGPVSWKSYNATERTRNPYSNYGYYFITQTDEEPAQVDSITFLNSFYPSPDDYHSLYEVDGYSWYHGGRKLFDTHAIENGASQTIIIPNIQEAQNGTLTVSVTSGVKSTADVYLNGELKGTHNIILGEYDKGNENKATYTFFSSGISDTITVKTVSGGPVRIDYVSIAWDKPRQAPHLASASIPVPEYVYNITNQDHHADPQADMVIIIPTSQKLLQQAQRLADFHTTHDSLRVNIVPADELYNEFASGTPDANAYRRYLKMLYDRAKAAEDMPKYLLLFGDCVWDNRMLTAECKTLNADDYLLAYESENSFNEVTCYVNDGWFTSIDDGEGVNPQSSDKEDVAVGRFPVTTDAMAKIMVDKTINYAKNDNVGNWQNTIMFMGDDGNNNLHMRDVNTVAEGIADMYPDYQIKKVMWDAYTRVSTSTGNTYPEATKAIKTQQQQGALIMDYAGHGSELQLSHEAVLKIDDFSSFNNKNLPLWITASCDIMPFDGTEPTIGEAAVLNDKGGAVAFFGTTRTVYANYNKYTNDYFMRHVLSLSNGKPTTLGEAQRLAKNDLIINGADRTTNKLQYALLGDPALALNLPTAKVVIDSINGISPGNHDKMPYLKAGSTARVKGHIEYDGKRLNTYKGMMTATVHDTRELVICKKQEETTEKAFQYYDRQKMLYNGSDSIRNGEFTFVFAVPRDINYTDGNGLISVFATNTDHSMQAHGAEEGFYINGSDSVSNDSIGPSLYCYLNDPSFVNGGDVNTTPYFVAQITDRNGINAAGNGVGHDLELVIDGDPTKTYILNGNFRYDFGSYTSGTTYYSIPALTAGKHTLKFKAWDILNNSSTATLSFNVVDGLQPEITNINVTENPAKASTTFIVTHNFSGNNINVIIDVFDLSGKLLWQHEENGVSSGNAYTVAWDLMLNNNTKLQTGVYLYRVRLSCNGSSQVSKAKKLIVQNNN